MKESESPDSSIEKAFSTTEGTHEEKNDKVNTNMDKFVKTNYGVKNTTVTQLQKNQAFL